MTGPARDWLATRRQELNGRFRAAQRRFPRLAPDVVLGLCRELLPALAGDGEAGSAELLSAAYDLILLHAGRGILAPGGGALGLGVLFREAFPRLRALLRSRPAYLPAALSNAVENLGPRGAEFARGLASMADSLAGAEMVMDAGAVLAWRLGEARLRGQALERAARLPPGVTRVALGVGCPDEAVPGLLAGLAADGWRQQEEILAPRTEWALVGRLGNFRGYGGHFTQPPLLLDAGGRGGRHRFWVRCDGANYRIDADVFGWVCRPDPSVDFPPRAVKGRQKRPEQLPPEATSFAEAEGLVAYTLADSFRVRVLARRPL